MARNEAEQKAINHEYAGWISPYGVSDFPSMTEEPAAEVFALIDPSTSIRTVIGETFASCEQTKITTQAPEHIPFVATTALDLKGLMEEPPTPISISGADMLVGEATRECYCEESSADSQCKPCTDVETLEDPLVNNMGVSIKAAETLYHR